MARPVWHCSLRAAPADPLLGDPGWAVVAGETLSEVPEAPLSDVAATGS
jgi:hypothetical protein